MEKLKDRLKEVFRKMGKRLVISMSLSMILISVLAGAIYFLTLEDAKRKEGDWSSTPYAASEYINGVAIEKDGTIKSEMTAEELWKKMQENKSNVKGYLKDAAELARLMRAELVTQYPDTRPNPDQPIDWEKVIEEEDKIQGIIKFKRSLEDGEKLTMSYIDPDTFQGYIDEYNKTRK